LAEKSTALIKGRALNRKAPNAFLLCFLIFCFKRDKIPS